jgi:alpha-D-ribose 1-methylphosphonate 5-triphosphate synthase subunit PhnL
VDEANILEVRDLSKTVQLHILETEVQPFTRVGFDVEAGELVAIVGPSGSGKSSIVKTIHRTYLPTTGEAWFRTSSGEVIDLASAPDREIIRLRRQEIGFVSQFLKVEPRTPTVETRRGSERRSCSSASTSRGGSGPPTRCSLAAASSSA